MTTDKANSRFIIEEDLIINPSTSPDWLPGSYLFSGTGIEIKSSPDSPKSMHVDGGNTDRFGISSPNGQTLSIDGLHQLSFSNIHSIQSEENAQGSAIQTTGTEINITRNGSVLFSNNQSASVTDGTPTVHGGAIYADKEIHVQGNGDIAFTGNAAHGTAAEGTSANFVHMFGGAVYSSQSVYFQSNTGSISFTDNETGSDTNTSAMSFGGALHSDVRVWFSENEQGISFIRNGIKTPHASTGYRELTGGAINAAQVVFQANRGDLIFQGNGITGATYGVGGGIAVENQQNMSGGTVRAANLYILSNENVTFENNYLIASEQGQGLGGAVFSRTNIYMQDNGNILFTGNKVAGATAKGGAIYLASGGNLYLEGNGNTTFAANHEINTETGTYLLRSIYAESSSETILAASEGTSITFMDSVYINGSSLTNGVINLNQNSSGLATTGTIRFTGASTLRDLTAIKGSSVTEDEIRASRSSQIIDTLNLVAGTLSIEDEAIVRFANKGSRASTINAGATLALSGGRLEIDGRNLNLNSSSTLSLSRGALDDAMTSSISTELMATWTDCTIEITGISNELSDTPFLSVDVSLLNPGELAYVLNYSDTLAAGTRYDLITCTGSVVEDLVSAAKDTIMINGALYNTEDYLHWDASNNTLYLQFDGGLIPEPSSTVLLGSSLVILAMYRRRRWSSGPTA